jgi:hypothetical protein
MCSTGRYLSFAVALSLVLPHSALTRQHLVAWDEIAGRLQAAALERASDELKVDQLLSSRDAAAAAFAHGVDIQRLRAGVAALSDYEVQDLARRADALQADPVAGGIVKTLVIVAVVVLVIVLLAAAIVESCKEQGAECVN